MPALAAGQWVISDRFTDSSYAYQGGGRELGIETVAALDAQVLADFRPDLTIVLDVDIATGLERATREAEADRFESEQTSFFQRVRETFLTLAEADRYRVIDAGQPIEKVQVDLTEVIVEFIGSH